jgi:GNAT superfamily N-acetyltransferase
VQIASSQFAYRAFLPADYLDSLSEANYEAFWRHRFETTADLKVWLATEGDDVIGLCATSRSDEPDATPDTAEVGFLYVTPEYIGKGIGHRLFEHALHSLRECGYYESTLWVIAENHLARRFYERNGWATDGAEMHQDRGGMSVLQVRYRRLLSGQELAWG